MTMNPATTDDVVAQWRPLSDQEVTNAEVLLDVAWAALQVQAPAVADYVYGSLGEVLIRYAVVSAALRALKNPDWAKTESIDDYSFTRIDVAASGAISFTDDELAMVRGEPIPRAMSVSMDSWA